MDLNQTLDIIYKSVEENKPLYIKNFLKLLNVDDSVKKFLSEYKKPEDINSYLKGASYVKTNKNTNYEFIGKLKDLFNTPNYLVEDDTRFWCHEAGNLTQFHYDGNGIEVLNVCLAGKKKFTLSPPGSQLNVPFSNISLIKYDADVVTEYILEPGDLLLIPHFWYHEVLTLENGTVTININFVDKNINIPNDKLTVYKIHEKLKTEMSNMDLFKIVNDLEIDPFSFIYNYLLEMICLFLLFILIIWIQKKIQFNYINEIFIIFLLGYSIDTWKTSLGISYIFTINYILIYSVYTLFH